jgi:LuxR family maltose regulon positive regulatory protein
MGHESVNAYPFPITGAKIHPPLLRSDTLSRPRLNTWLESATGGRVALIVAEAGYGKTTLLADWASKTARRTAWYRLEADDRDWLVFIRHLVAAGRELDPDFGIDTLDLITALGSGGPAQADLVAAIAREFAEFGAALPDGLTLLVDDYHAVDGSDDTATIMKSLIDRTGDGFSIVIASRATPRLALSRLRTHGGLRRMDGQTLSFDVNETGSLFRDVYHRPLESDVVAQLSERTEGWAALLALVRTGLEDRPTQEARALVAQLSATRGDLYDFLAEEVLAMLPQKLQRFLTRASVLASVDVQTGCLVDEVSSAQALALIAEAESLGLLARPDRESPHRFHPLVRDFLQARLRDQVGEDEVARLHLRVATALELSDWQRAAWHYRAGGLPEEAGRVVDDHLREIIASGLFEKAAPFLDGSAGLPNRAPALILRSRLEFGRGQVAEAMRLAEQAVEVGSAATRGTALLNLAGLNGVTGYDDRGVRLATEALDAELSLPERHIAEAILAVRSLAHDGDLVAGASLLAQLAAHQIREGQRRFAAITLLILSSTLLALGRPGEALARANDAHIQITASGSSGLELVSILVAQATAHLFLGAEDRAKASLAQAESLAANSSLDEVHLEKGRLFAALGEVAAANRAIDSLRHETLHDGYRSIYEDVRMALCIRARDGRAAQSHLAYLEAHPGREVGSELAKIISSIRIAVLLNTDREGLLAQGRDLATRQGSRPGRHLVEVLSAVSGSDPIDSAVSLIPDETGYCLSLVAEELVEQAARLTPAALARVSTEVQARPERWRQSLIREVERDNENAVACSVLLARIGTREDAVHLRTLAARSKRLRPAALELTLRLAPNVYVHDLGPVVTYLGGEPLRIVRRKVLTLLCFLITQPSMAATRDEVLEALWPELPPDTAGNSLHQTIYYLRRIFEPDYREGLSAGYVAYDGELVTLNAGLVFSASRDCWALLRGKDRHLVEASRLIDLYKGRFALDFAYEDWAADYRETLHAAVLAATEEALTYAAGRGQVETAIALGQRMLEIDPEADAIELGLLRAYKRSGRLAAAAEQYAHYSSLLREQLGVEPQPLEDL